MALATFLLVLLAGCSLSNPYVKIDTPATHGCDANCSIDAAQAYSRSVRDAYRKRLGTYSTLRNNSGAAIVLLGAATLGLGAADAHRDAFVGAGLTGATTYGLSQWFGNPRYEDVLVAGIGALTCAESAVEPLRLSGDETDELKRGLKDVLAEVATLQTAVNHMRSYEVGARDAQEKYKGKDEKRFEEIKSLLARAFRAQETADTAIAAIRSAYGDAVRLRHASHTAGYRLVRTVERIAATVDAEARKSQPDPASVFKIVGDLAAFAGRIVPGLKLDELLNAQMAREFKTQGAALTKIQVSFDKEAWKQAIGAVETQAAALALTAEQLKALVSQFSGVNVIAGLEACNLGDIAGFKISPEKLPVTAGGPAVKFTVRGGKPPFTATFIGKLPTDVALDSPVAGDRTFTLTAKADATAGEFVIAVADATLEEKELPVTISSGSKDEEKDNPGTSKDAAKPAAKPAPRVSPADMNDLASLVGKLKGKTLPGTLFVVASAMASGSTIEVRGAPAPANDDERDKIRDILLDQVEGGSKIRKQIPAGVTLKVVP